ncbi:MAG: hypothetical protein LKJ88_06905 [Bacilli bacterium]|jgi:hypothetical protein|nr:hypothetical protein [Bacilli bacterium]
MQLSYLLLLVWLIIVIIGFFSSESHVLKSAVCALLASSLTALYVYLEKIFTKLTSFASMSHYFYNLLKGIFSSRNMGEYERQMISQGIFIFLIFALIFLLSFFIMLFFSFGKAPSQKNIRISKPFSLVFFVAIWAFISAFFISWFAPLFQIPLGFLGGFMTSLRWGLS